MAILKTIKYQVLIDDEYIGFDDSEIKEGTIKIDENGFFEGVVRKKDSPNVDLLVFGIYHPNQLIQLFEISSKGYILFGEKEDDKYRGIVSKDYLGKVAVVGYSNVTTEDLDVKYLSTIDYQINQCKNSIAGKGSYYYSEEVMVSNYNLLSDSKITLPSKKNKKVFIKMLPLKQTNE